MPLLLALLLLLPDGAAADYDSPTAPGDVKALCDLYFATGGATGGWKRNDGFHTCRRDGTASSDPCDASFTHWLWEITTYGTGTVTYGVVRCDMAGGWGSSRVTQL
jgi:hypothetical protein